MSILFEFQLDAGFLHDHTVNKHHTFKTIACLFGWLLFITLVLLENEEYLIKIAFQYLCLFLSCCTLNLLMEVYLLVIHIRYFDQMLLQWKHTVHWYPFNNMAQLHWEHLQIHNVFVSVWGTWSFLTHIQMR